MDKDTALRTAEWATGILAQLDEGDIDGAKEAIADGLSAGDLEPMDLQEFITINMNNKRNIRTFAVHWLWQTIIKCAPIAKIAEQQAAA